MMPQTCENFSMESQDVTLSSEDMELSTSEEEDPSIALSCTPDMHLLAQKAAALSTPKKKLSMEEVVQRCWMCSQPIPPVSDKFGRLGVESVRLYRQRKEERRAAANENFQRMTSRQIPMSPYSRQVVAEREKLGETMFDRTERMMQRRRQLEQACKEKEEEEIKKLQKPPQMCPQSRKIVSKMSRLGVDMIDRSNKLLEKRRNAIEEGRGRKDMELREMQNRQKISPGSKKLVEGSTRASKTTRPSIMSHRFINSSLDDSLRRSASSNSTSSRRAEEDRKRSSLPEAQSKYEPCFQSSLCRGEVSMAAQRSVEFLPEDMKEFERLQWENAKMKSKIKKYRKQLQAAQKGAEGNTPVQLLISHSNMVQEHPISRRTIEAMGGALIKESFKLMRTVMTDEELALKLNELLKAQESEVFSSEFETKAMQQVEPLFNIFFHCIRCASKQGINLETMLSSLVNSYPEDVLARFDEEGQDSKGFLQQELSDVVHGMQV
ncbi:hypothetical protein GUITHDRAFT_104786 [Guillardia theta CCMP2712]|uniref:Uncharacterized protein n=1 Tax=Guillardia theta (strain CCMP2712) TaxID=905079 RepID=L1JL75_GUITC|nr:hypothetical protein GUITHDRAFT_104786 [Guillardia theta CCMP2712]EKX49258.1 hypothetical protein GUITHDRAFT_104786 [Guillardia theta CCMP2712]|eukprot:XP_005836238.1 hypothetical protein GUITHDRAFT_104786 [Guillardia theta CCMP2712]